MYLCAKISGDSSYDALRKQRYIEVDTLAVQINDFSRHWVVPSHLQLMGYLLSSLGDDDEDTVSQDFHYLDSFSIR